jgi:hypothetical protein
MNMQIASDMNKLGHAAANEMIYEDRESVQREGKNKITRNELCRECERGGRTP